VNAGASLRDASSTMMGGRVPEAAEEGSVGMLTKEEVADGGVSGRAGRAVAEDRVAGEERLGNLSLIFGV